MKGNLKRPDFRELMNPLLRTTAGILFFSWFFYRSVFAVILFIFPGILYFRKCVREQREKKRWELTVQFKECLLAVANSLRTGYAVENAFLESREDIRLLFGERSAMYGELELIRRGMIVNITLEELIGDLAERSGCEEIPLAILFPAFSDPAKPTPMIRRITIKITTRKTFSLASMAFPFVTLLSNRLVISA